MGGFRTEQEIGIEVDRRVTTGGRVQTDGNGGRRCGIEKCVHAQRLGDVRIIRDVDLAQRYWLKRLLRCLSQDRRGPVAYLLAGSRCLVGPRGVAFGANDIVQRGREVRVGEPLRHDTIRDALVPRLLTPGSYFDDGTDSRSEEHTS